jgi:hypothetical protein
VFGGEQVGVVHHEGLPGLDAGAEQQRLPVTGAQHVEIDADMGVGEVLLEEGRFAGCLNAREYDRLHETQSGNESAITEPQKVRRGVALTP